MRVEATSVARRVSFAPLVALLLVAAIVATSVALTLALTRPHVAAAERPTVGTYWGVDRQTLVRAGFTGRLGGTTVTERPTVVTAWGVDRGTNWVQRAEDAGFTGRLGG